MTPEEIFKKIRRIEIIARKEAQNIFAGEYHSAFKGRGMEFSEVREYQPGDDPRMIDWNVTSRTGRIHVKQFVEERELTVILAVDLSPSLHFFSSGNSKNEIAAEISALIAFAAILNNDKVGLLIFTDGIELYIPPKKGKIHLLRLVRDILNFTPSGRGTSLQNALTYLSKVIKKKAVVFLISDFIDDSFSTGLKIAGRKHDLIAIDIADHREIEPPATGVFLLRDAESGEVFPVDFGDPKVRQGFLDRRRSRIEELDTLFTRYRCDFLHINNRDDYEKPLFDLFMRRKKKINR